MNLDEVLKQLKEPPAVKIRKAYIIRLHPDLEQAAMLLLDDYPGVEFERKDHTGWDIYMADNRSDLQEFADKLKDIK